MVMLKFLKRLCIEYFVILSVRTIGKKGRDFLLGMPFEKFCKLLPDYQPEDISLLFAW